MVRLTLRYVEAVARTIGQHINHHVVVVTKSTVPVGTGEQVRQWVQASLDERGVEQTFSIASNPEFLKEGAAIDDFMSPDRVVLGCEDKHAETVLRHLYGSFMRNGLRFFTMDVRSAEMTKYASNCMLATKISFINEMSNLCDTLGADVELVRQGAGADKRIGMSFFHPGVGYGGSCFPKDVQALIRMAENSGYEPRILHAVDQVNRDQLALTAKKISAWATLHEKPLSDLTVAIWGLAFKPNTDDIRQSPGVGLAQYLLAQGAQVQAHDPHAMPNAAAQLGEQASLKMCDNAYQAAEGADVMCLMTEWRPYRRPDWKRITGLMHGNTVFDGRNQYDPERLRELGIQCYGIGTGERIAT